MRRIMILMTASVLIFSSIWLAAISLSHAQMLAGDECAIAVSIADCAGTPVHTLHVLTHQLTSLGLTGLTIPSSPLLILLVLMSVVGIFWFWQRQHRLIRPQRHFSHVSELLTFFVLKRYRAWRVTLQELHPSIAH